MKRTQSLCMIMLIFFYSCSAQASSTDKAAVVITLSTMLYALSCDLANAPEDTRASYLCMDKMEYSHEVSPFPIRCARIDNGLSRSYCFPNPKSDYWSAYECNSHFKLLNENEIKIIKAKQQGLAERQKAAKQKYKKYLEEQAWELKNHKWRCKNKPKKFARYNQKCLQRSKSWWAHR